MKPPRTKTEWVKMTLEVAKFVNPHIEWIAEPDGRIVSKHGMLDFSLENTKDQLATRAALEAKGWNFKAGSKYCYAYRRFQNAKNSGTEEHKYNTLPEALVDCVRIMKMEGE